MIENRSEGKKGRYDFYFYFFVGRGEDEEEESFQVTSERLFMFPSTRHDVSRDSSDSC